MWGHGLDQAGSGKGQVEDTCECGNENLSSIKRREFLYWMKLVSLKDSALWSNYG